MNTRHQRSDLVDTKLANRINYAQCWEDERVLQDALQVGEGDVVLSIASAGDNSMALAIAGAERVVAIDLSLPQLHLTELKLVGAGLRYEEYLQLLGLLSGGRRVYLYHQIRERLSPAARDYWNDNEGTIRVGILGLGRFERYLGKFRTGVLPIVPGRAVVEEMLSCADLEAQRAVYRRWNGRRWRGLFRLFFSRQVMQRTGRDPAQFAHVDGPVSAEFLRRCEHALTELPVAGNPYVEWMLRGTYQDPAESSRLYLTRAGHARLQQVAHHVELVHADLESYLPTVEPGTFSAFNFSNLFEYVSAESHESMLRLAIGAAQPGARMAYWNLLVPRSRPESLAGALVPQPERAAELLFRDRAWVYGGFQLEVVT